MQYNEYMDLFDEILNNPKPPAPYDDAMYFEYTKLNRSRMNRWEKQMVLDATCVDVLKQTPSPQHWIIITEPWCGDAAHIVPFLVRMASVHSMITYDLVLRDAPPFLIEQYLTNGTKSIPILIVRNAAGEDLFTWGPRPVGAQQLMENMKAAQADFETTKVALQNWYNADKGQEICAEMTALLKQHTLSNA